MRPYEFLNGAWENSEHPTIVKDDPNGGDPHILASLRRIYNPEALYELCRLANERVDLLPAAPAQAVTPGAGWKLVPVEPTEEMLLAMAAAPKWSWSALTIESATARYAAMLSASPSPAGRESLESQIDTLHAENERLVKERDEATSEAQDTAATFVFETLARALKVDNWTISDGSETWEGDVSGTLYGILRQAKVLDPETDELATARAEAAEAALAKANERIAELEAEVGRLREAAERIRAIFYGISFTESTESTPLFRRLTEINDIAHAVLFPEAKTEGGDNE